VSIYGLIAWADHQRVGTLTYDDDTALFAFAYDPEWVGQKGAFSVSPALPFERPSDLTAERHSTRVRRFFENLLPEGRALDDAAAANGVSKAHLYALLRVLGSESAGLLSLLPEGMPSSDAGAHREITFQELSERIRDRASHPFNVWDGRVRMSIAGHQDKLAVYMENDRLFLADGRFSSTHILKPEPLDPRMAGLVANEHFCLAFAAKLGLPAAPAQVLRVPEPVLVVERFDRRVHPDGRDLNSDGLPDRGGRSGKACE
jgi:serine/threonine-protein kinase HipA